MSDMNKPSVPGNNKAITPDKQADPAIIELLIQIKEKLNHPKKGFWDIASIILTLISTVAITTISIIINKQNSREQRELEKSSLDKEAIFRKAEIFEKWSPYLATDDSIKNKIAIVAIYTLDTGLSLKLASIINSPGTQSAVKSLFKNADSSTQKAIENILLKNDEQTSAPPKSNQNDVSSMALKKAFAEFDRKVKEIPPRSNGGPDVKIFLNFVGLSEGVDWAGAFIVWCFLSDDQFKDKYSFMRTGDIGKLLRSLDTRKLTFNANEKSIIPGDILFYDINKTDTVTVDHCGIVYSVDKDLLYTIEGNCNTGDEYDGGVGKRIRKLTSVYKVARIKD